MGLQAAPRPASGPALAWRYAKGDPRALSLEETTSTRRIPGPWPSGSRPSPGRRPLGLVSDHLGRYGEAYLQTEQAENGRAVWLNYGSGKGHSHHDCLAMGLLAKNLDMLADHGYPGVHRLVAAAARLDLEHLQP